MKKVLIIHGLGGSDYPHWQSWLASELIKLNYTVSFPALPNRDNPDLKEWLEFINAEVKHFKPDIVVCHSLANLLWFHLVDKYDISPIEKLMLVAPVSQQCTVKELQSFLPYPIPSDLRAKEVIMACGDNDPYISVEEAINLQSSLNIGMKIMENAGHINRDSGFGELSFALEWVQR